MLPSGQVERVLSATDIEGLEVVALASALGLEDPSQDAEGRVLVCRGRDGAERMGFKVTGGLHETELEGSALVALPRVLVRLRPAPWLAGIARTGSSLALIIDLAQLTDELLRLRPETPDAAERMH